MKCLWLGAATALLMAGSASAEARAAQTPAPVTQAACATGLPAGTRCGTIDVPEDWANPGGRHIQLNFAVVPGETGGHDVAPLVLLAGGPGQGAVQIGPMLLGELRSVQPAGDILLIDQRGTGRSNPLTCAAGFQLMASGDPAQVRSCLTELQARAALGHYRTQDAVRDLEAARAALGYERINLIAGSYGTRLAGAYMRAHPDRTRAAILRAVAPPGFNIIGDGFANADAELERALAGCEADPACAADFPRLRERKAEIERRLAQAPERVRAPSGAEIEVTPAMFQQILYALLLTAPSRQQIPLVIDTFAAQGFQPLAPIVQAIRDQLYGQVPVGMYLSIVCAEDAPRLAPGALAGARGLAAMAPAVLDVCRAWPAGQADPELHAPLTVPVPTLIVTGDLDPATNVAAAERLADTLPQARHVVVPATAHAPMLPQCVRPAARALLETGRLPEAATDCSGVRLPAFARRPQAAPAAAQPAGN